MPIYLHINFTKDTPGCVVLWWYASTCRHLGIGGTHKDPAVAAAQKAAMRKYHGLERFFKRGEFYGINEEIHLHALPEENAFVATCSTCPTGSERSAAASSWAGWFCGPGGWQTERKMPVPWSKAWTIRRDLPPWSAEMVYVKLAR